MRVVPVSITRSGSQLDKSPMPQATGHEPSSQTSHLVGAHTVGYLMLVNVFESASSPLDHCAQHTACKIVLRRRRRPASLAVVVCKPRGCTRIDIRISTSTSLRYGHPHHETGTDDTARHPAEGQHLSSHAHPPICSYATNPYATHLHLPHLLTCLDERN